ncbi:MAG: Mor transcription activator family protein [Oxalobacteraceae bacterium]|nr:Mor transcription activator family protein [Oxalobacteraceae bacterium]
MANHLFLDDSYPEVLADIARTIHERLMEDPRIKLPHPIAAEVAMSVAEHVRKNIGGVATYIPRGINYELTLRDKQMWMDFKGDNYSELARKYNLTDMRVRQVMERISKIERARRQQNLFEASDLA